MGQLILHGIPPYKLGYNMKDARDICRLCPGDGAVREDHCRGSHRTADSQCGGNCSCVSRRRAVIRFQDRSRHIPKLRCAVGKPIGSRHLSSRDPLCCGVCPPRDTGSCEITGFRAPDSFLLERAAPGTFISDEAARRIVHGVCRVFNLVAPSQAAACFLVEDARETGTSDNRGIHSVPCYVRFDAGDGCVRQILVLDVQLRTRIRLQNSHIRGDGITTGLRTGGNRRQLACMGPGWGRAGPVVYRQESKSELVLCRQLPAAVFPGCMSGVLLSQSLLRADAPGCFASGRHSCNFRQPASVAFRRAAVRHCRPPCAGIVVSGLTGTATSSSSCLRQRPAAKCMG